MLLLWTTGTDPCGRSAPGRYKLVLVTRTGRTAAWRPDNFAPDHRVK